MTTRKNQKGGMFSIAVNVAANVYSRYSQAIARNESNQLVKKIEEEASKALNDNIPASVRDQINRAATKAFQKVDESLRSKEPEIKRDILKEVKEKTGCTEDPQLSCPNTNSQGLSGFALPNSLYRLQPTTSNKRSRLPLGVYSNKVQKEIGETSGTDTAIEQALKTSSNPTLRNLDPAGIDAIIKIVKSRKGGKRRRTIKKRKSKRRRTRRKH